MIKQIGAAPPAVPAQVMLWLATRPEADAFQRCMIDAQPFAKEQGIVA